MYKEKEKGSSDDKNKSTQTLGQESQQPQRRG